MRAIERRHLICFLYPAIVGAGAWMGGWYAWASFFLGGSIYPLLDAIPAARIRAEPESAHLGTGHRLLAIFAFVEIALLGFILWLVAQGGLAPWELVGVAASLGTLTGGIGIPAAHELIHGRRPSTRALGLLLLAPVLYMHFRIEHVYGHHVRVATVEDPATARKGEALWPFIVRSVIGQVRSAYRIEERLRAATSGKRCRANRVLVYFAVEAGLAALVLLIFGGAALAVFAGQALVAILFLESTNYIEHYGLQRRRLAGGRYEKISVTHSWNSPSFLTNSLAFNLGLHSDHHAHAQRPFTQLRDQPDAPLLPAGYLAMISIAAIPPLWRRIMDPRLSAFHASQANPIPEAIRPD